LTNLSSSDQIISSLNDLKNATSQSFDSQILAMQEKVKQAKT
jgi:hypothetical protein